MLTRIRENEWQRRRGQCLQLQWNSWVSEWDRLLGYTSMYVHYIYRERWEWNVCSMGMKIPTWEATNSHFSHCNKASFPCWSNHIYPSAEPHTSVFPSLHICIKLSFPVLSFKILDRSVPTYHFLFSNWLNDCSSSLSTPLTSMKLKYQENTFLTRLINDSILSLCRSLPLPHFIHPSEQNETTEEINFPAAQNEAESMSAKHFLSVKGSLNSNIHTSFEKT